MQWTVNWFRWKKEQWNKRLSDLEDKERPPRLDCDCHKQMALWGSLAGPDKILYTVGLAFALVAYLNLQNALKMFSFRFLAMISLIVKMDIGSTFIISAINTNKGHIK